MQHGNEYRLLIVEDEAIVALAEQSMLQSAGYVVTTCGTGEDAVDIIARGEPIDLVLMDIDLGPGIDGVEAARRILAITELPIVFLTSHAEREYVDLVKTITRYGYVLKGSGSFVLLEAISTAFELFGDRMRLARENRTRELAEKELAAIYEYAPISLIVVGSDMRVRRVNSRLANFSGDRAQDPIGKAPGEVMNCLHHLDHPDGCGYGPFCRVCPLRSAVIETFATREGVPESRAQMAKIIDGEPKTVFVRFSTGYVEVEDQRMVVVSIADITAEVESQRRYRSLYESMPSGFALHRLIWDEHGDPVDYEFVEANAVFGRLTGLDPVSIIGRRVTEVIPGICNDGTDWISRYAEVVRTGETIQFTSYSETLAHRYEVTAFAVSDQLFGTVFVDADVANGSNSEAI